MTLIPTDRSRFRLGWGQCMRARWLQYHSGPTGYGISYKPQQIPLVTGILEHRVLAEIIWECVRRGEQEGIPGGRVVDADREWVRPLIARACLDYKKAVERRGFEITGAEVGTDELQFLIAEQSSLLEGLTWGAFKVFLPWLFAEWEVVACEREEELVAACTCGLGSLIGGAQEHEARGCEGLLIQLRPDLILKSRLSGVYSNCDFKTGAQVKYKSWADQYQVADVQLALGTLGAERRLGVQIPEAYIFGLHKGPRKTTYLPDGSQGPRRQDSVFCYAWRKPANPPHWEEEWRFSWEYVDEQGKNRNLKGKGFEKAPVWEADLRRPPGWTSMEYVVEAVLPAEVLRQQFVVVGPIQRPRHLVQRLVRALEHEELRWVTRNWEIHQALAAADGNMQDPEVVEALDEHAPQSWECQRYRSRCQFWKVCDGAMADPLASGFYELRRPHHEYELQQMRARGIEPPEEHWDEEEDEE